MKTKITLLLFIFSIYSYKAQTLQWANAMLGATGGAGKRVAVDASGNIYTVGAFGGVTDFDPGAGTFTLTPAGGLDAFISKLDASGNFVWATQLGGSGTDLGDAITLDGTGDVLVNINYAGGGAKSVVKLAAATGATVWTKNIEAVGVSIDTDGTGNIYTGGSFTGTKDFDPGVGTATVAAVSGDGFITKLDASGNFVWAKIFTGPSSEAVTSISTDASGNVCAVGNFSGTADFDPGAGTYTLSSSGNVDVFILKLDASGNFLWAKRIGEFSVDNGTSISFDPGGNVLVTGIFTGGLPAGAADFDPGPGVFNLNSATGGGAYVLKLDGSGNFVWAKNFGGVSQCIATDAAGNVYTTGAFSGGPNDFNPGSGTYTLATAGGNDIFLSKLDASGNFVMAGLMGGTNNDLGQGLAVDATENVHITGYFNGTADFDPSSSTFTITAPGTTAGYIYHVKIASTPVSGIDENNITDHISVYPNPFSSEVNFRMNSVSTVTLIVRNVLGQEIRNISSENGNFTMNRDDLVKGIYFYTLISENRVIGSGKLMAE